MCDRRTGAAEAVDRKTGAAGERTLPRSRWTVCIDCSGERLPRNIPRRRGCASREARPWGEGGQTAGKPELLQIRDPDKAVIGGQVRGGQGGGWRGARLRRPLPEEDGRIRNNFRLFPIDVLPRGLSLRYFFAASEMKKAPVFRDSEVLHPYPVSRAE